jgi:TonB-linked SusC/RagA family outer membrane protein
MKNKHQNFQNRFDIKRIIRLMIIMLIISVNLIPVQAQNTIGQEKKKIKMTNVTVQQLVDKLGSNFKYSFFIVDEQVGKMQVSVDLKNATIEEILDHAFQGKSIIYSIKDKSITISVKKNQSTSKNPQKSELMNISGIVYDESHQPLIGASLMVNNSTIGTITDVNGRFSLTTPTKGKLKVSYIGSESKIIELDGKSAYEISLNSSVHNLNEVVAIGYGSLSKKEVSSSIVSVSKENFLQSAVSNPMELVTGKVAGLNVNSTAAANPNSTPSLQIRGATSLSAGNGPLIVINDVPGGDLASVSPQDIESITVLKDGASAAIYGTRGSNGVILVKTKQGTTGSSKFSATYDSWFGVNLLKDVPRVLTTDEFRKYRTSKVDYGGNTNWYKAIMNDFVYDNNQYIGFDGSTQKGWYSASLNYKDSKGMEKNNQRTEYGGRFDMSQKTLNNLVEFTGSINLRKTKSQNSNAPFSTITIRNPTLPIYNEDGTYYIATDPAVRTNPVEELNENKSFTDGLYLRTNIGLKLNLIKTENQFLNTAITLYYQQNGYDNQYYSPSIVTKVNNSYAGYASLSNTVYNDRSFDWVTNYFLKINDQSLKVVTGYTYQDFTNTNRSMNNSDFTYDDFLWNNIGSGGYLPAGKSGMSSDKSIYKLIALFGRANYNWKDLIFASASLRYEGSTKFGENNKWGYFPAASVAWEMANMNFIKNNISQINSLKLRASYGVTGRSGFSSYQSIATYGSSGYYNMNGAWITAFTPNRNPNPDLKWEKGVNTNLGLDFSLFGGRLSGSVDYFDRQSRDLLYSYSAPQPPMIFSTILVNVGTVVNRGWELTLEGEIIKNNNLSWNSNIMFSTGKSRLKSLTNDVYGASYLDMYQKPGIGTTEYLFRYKEGSEIGQFYGYRHAGISTDGKLMIYNKDGVAIVKGQEKVEDKVYLGSGVPKAFLSWNNTFRYKNFDLNVFFTGALGFKIMNFEDYSLGFSSNAADNVLLKAYTERSNITGASDILTSYHLHDGTYMKLQNITLGYTTRFKNNYINKLRVFAAAKNLYTFTSYDGRDPSAVDVTGLTPGVDTYGAYPASVELSLGLTVNF